MRAVKSLVGDLYPLRSITLFFTSESTIPILYLKSFPILDCQFSVRSHPWFSMIPAFSIGASIPNRSGVFNCSKISEVRFLYQSNVPLSLLSNKPKSIPTLKFFDDSHVISSLPILDSAYPICILSSYI